MSNNDEIDNAKETLKRHGYQVDNLWSINDVKDRFMCDDGIAHDIIYRALTNEATIEQIQLAIAMEADARNLSKIKPQN